MAGALNEVEPRTRRNVGIRQADVARAIRGALQAGIEIREVIATRDGIRIVSGSVSAAVATNSWDEVLDDG
jgi:putative heme degradation protein